MVLGFTLLELIISVGAGLFGGGIIGYAGTALGEHFGVIKLAMGAGKRLHDMRKNATPEQLQEAQDAGTAAIESTREDLGS